MDVTIEDQTEEPAMLALQGQASQDTLQACVEGLDLSTVGYYRSGFGTLCGMPGVRVSRTGYTGEDGFELYFPAGEAERVWEELTRTGADHGQQPIRLGARDTLRHEARMPLYGHEIDEEHNPIEAGLSFGVSFHEDKGDWIVGRPSRPRRRPHARARRHRHGRQARRARAIPSSTGTRSSGRSARRGSPPSTRTSGRRIPVALATATAVEMDLRGKRQACTVTDLPSIHAPV